MGKNNKTLRQKLNTEETAGIICTLPFTFGFLAFTIVPMLMSLYYAFTDYDIKNPPVWAGLKNFIKMFTDDPRFVKSLQVTFYFALTSVPLRLIFALLVALLLLRTTKATSFYRAAYYLPSIIGGSVAVSILWKRMFAKEGVVNAILGMFGIHTTFAWLGNKHTAIWVLVVLAVWQFGSSMIIFAAGLKEIPGSYYEAAEIDGANKWQRFLSITLPCLSPIILYNLVMQTITAFMAFTQAFVITQGGPNDATNFYALYVYNHAFKWSNMGYASAMSWLMLVLISVITLILFKSSKFWVFSEADQ